MVFNEAKARVDAIANRKKVALDAPKEPAAKPKKVVKPAS
jgi:hypothetical protein